MLELLQWLATFLLLSSALTFAAEKPAKPPIPQAISNKQAGKKPVDALQLSVVGESVSDGSGELSDDSPKGQQVFSRKSSFAEATGIGRGSVEHPGVRLNPDFCALCNEPRSDCLHPLMDQTK